MELPLRGHNFGIDTRDLDTGVQAGLVVGFNDVTAEDLAGTDTAVVWSLRSRKTILRPAVWPVVGAKESVFLLETEPGLMLFVSVHQPSSLMTIIELVGAAVMVPGLAHDKDVVATTERIGEDGNGAKVDIRVIARSLTTRRSIEVPFRKLIRAFDRLVKCLCNGRTIISAVFSNCAAAQTQEWCVGICD